MYFFQEEKKYTVTNYLSPSATAFTPPLLLPDSVMSTHDPTHGLKIGLALGSGSARGLAHIGAIQELRQIGLKPAVVCGTSIGALVGAAYVCGHLDELEKWFRQMSTRDVFHYMEVRPISSRGGVGRAGRLIEYLREHYGSPLIESLPISFAAVGTDLASGRELWMQNGDIWDAVRGSIAIPALLSPVRIGGRWVVDGGLVNPVPVSVCRALGADIIIAINLNDDVGGRQQARIARQTQLRRHRTAEARAESGLLDRLTNGLKDMAPPMIAQWLEADQKNTPEDDTPGIFSVVTNSINIMQDRITRSRLAGEPADVLVTPRLAQMGLLDFDAAEPAIAEGRNAVRRALPLIRFALGLEPNV